ncbi:MAG: DNA polymerase III subunit delta [Patescibacteria group bacterium]
MLIFLYGPDSYRSRQKLKKIISDCADSEKKTGKGRLNLVKFNSENLNFQDFKNEIESSSIFREKKMVVLEDVFSDKNFKENFLENADKFAKSDTIITIYEGKEIDRRDSLFKFLEKKSDAEEFKALEERELSGWIKKEVEKRGAFIEADAQKELLLFVGSDLWQMGNEIEKLVNYSKAGRIKKEDVDLFVKPKIENDIFSTIDAIAARKKDEALLLMHGHLEKGDNPLYLLSMINFQFRNLVEIRDLMEKRLTYADILKRCKLHPFVIKKTYWQAQKFDFQQLKKIYRKIFQVDLAIKTGKIEAEVALDLLIAGL